MIHEVLKSNESLICLLQQYCYYTLYFLLIHSDIYFSIWNNVAPERKDRKRAKVKLELVKLNIPEEACCEDKIVKSHQNYKFCG